MILYFLNVEKYLLFAHFFKTCQKAMQNSYKDWQITTLKYDDLLSAIINGDTVYDS